MYSRKKSAWLSLKVANVKFPSHSLRKKYPYSELWKVTILIKMESCRSSRPEVFCKTRVFVKTCVGVDIYLQIDNTWVIFLKLFTNFPYSQITTR